MRLYNLVAINEKTGKTELLTSYPDTHEHCVTIKSKITPHKDVRVQLIEVSNMPSESFNDKNILLDPELEAHFQDYWARGGHDSAVAETILGDSAYVKKYRMPKWNILVDMLKEPRVAIRHGHELGIPTSKSAHAQRADYFERVAQELEAARAAYINHCFDTFGSQGPLISGVVRDHFPSGAKRRLRFLNNALNMVKDAQRLHEYLAKTRSPAFR